MADRYELTWISPSGQEWELTSLDWVAGIRAGGIEGLVGEPTDVAVSTPGEAGQVLDSQEYPAMRGTLRFAVRGDGEKSADDVWAELRQSFRHKQYGTLILRGSAYGNLSAATRRGGVIPPPLVDPASEEVILDVDVPVISDEGCWWTDTLTGTGTVTVSNSGDVPVYVKIRWSGSGGVVTLPSGATFTLPATPIPRILHLSSAQSLVVLTDSGVVDPILWKQVRGVALPELVPAEESRTFQLPSGATLEWQLGVMDPWQ